MENYPVLSIDNNSNNKRKHLKTLASNLNIKIGTGTKSHLNMFRPLKKGPKYLKTLTIEEYDIQQNAFLNKYRAGFEEENSKNKEVNTFRIPLDAKQLLLKGAKLKNTKWILGIVIYTGHDCKLKKSDIKRQ